MTYTPIPDTNPAPWMLYGCYGYSGELILRHAIEKGLRPIIAGRSDEKTRAIAEEFNLPYRTFSLDSQSVIEQNIADCQLVFNAAGPYTSTAIPMFKACLNKGIHNLSLAGEIPILEELHCYHDISKEKGVALAIGLGFDVMPTDALAAKVKEAMPDANHLLVGLDGPNDMSRGSMKEFFEQISEQPFWVRRQGKLIPSKPQTRRMNFGNGEKLASSIAWGDTASAFHSTGIPNIDVFAAVTRSDWLTIKALDACSFLFKSKRIQSLANKAIDKFLSGPNEAMREKGITYLFAEGRNMNEEKVRVSMTCPTGYKITYLGAVHAIEYMLKNIDIEGGYYTPAQLLGVESILQIEGVSNLKVEASK